MLWLECCQNMPGRSSATDAFTGRAEGNLAREDLQSASFHHQGRTSRPTKDICNAERQIHQRYRRGKNTLRVAATETSLVCAIVCPGEMGTSCPHSPQFRTQQNTEQRGSRDIPTGRLIHNKCQKCLLR